MGDYADQLFVNISEHLKNTGWGGMRYNGQNVVGIHLIMPEGMEMSKPFQQRIWDILEELPRIYFPPERVFISIRKPNWDHYYQTVINPKPDDFKTVGMLSGHVTKEEWERQKAKGFSRSNEEDQ